MVKPLLFSKYSGCGNDFILVDNRNLNFPVHDHIYIQKLCDRRLGIGADGLILLESSHISDFKMRIFNSDGKEAEMCGNGLRCLVHFANRLRMPKKSLIHHYSIETKAYISEAYIKNGVVTALMPDPKEMSQIVLEVNALPKKQLQLHKINTGVPHVVLFTEELEHIDISAIGSEIRYHPSFFPYGTNVNFANHLKDNDCIDNSFFEVRTYERGVEGETLACGTGATAVAIATHYQFGAKSPIKIQTRSKEIITIEFDCEGGRIHNVKMTGDAKHLFDGIFVAN